MSQDFDIEDDLLDLNLEVLSLIADSQDEGISTDEIYQKSEIAMDKQMVSKTVGGLRTQGKVASIMNSNNIRVFIVTEKGLNTLDGKDTAERYTLTESNPEYLESTSKTKSKSKIKGSTKKEATSQSSILTGLLPLRSLSGLRCMLSSDGTLTMDVAATAKTAAQHIEITPTQTKHLWYYLAQLYPKIVTLKTYEEKSKT